MKIIDYGINGEGIAKEGGKVYFVLNALPGEDVEVKITKESKNFCQAEATKILSKSKDRVSPLCPYFLTCGGCSLQHLKYNSQLKFKQNLVKNTLKKVGDIDIEVAETFPSNESYFYRNKCTFVAKTDDFGTCFGMYKDQSHDFIEVKECKIASNLINRVLNFCASFFKNKREENLSQIMIRTNLDSFLLTLISSGKLNFLGEFTKSLQENFKNFGLFEERIYEKNQTLSAKFKHIFGLEFLTLTEEDATLKVYPDSFLQVNNFVKNALYARILENIKPNDSVIDAYCGAGYLSYLTSKKAEKVLGIEVNSSAINSANELVGKRSNLKFVLGDVKLKLSNFMNDYSVLVLDPPRSGCEKQVLNILGKSKISKAIYVSCNPISLSRDLKILKSFGFSVKSVQPFDMFPNTKNVETIVVLKRQG